MFIFILNFLLLVVAVSSQCYSVPISTISSITCTDLSELKGCTVVYTATVTAPVVRGGCVAFKFLLHQNDTIYSTDDINYEIDFVDSGISGGLDNSWQATDVGFFSTQNSDCCCYLSPTCHHCDESSKDYCAGYIGPNVNYWFASDFDDRTCFSGRNARICGCLMGTAEGAGYYHIWPLETWNDYITMSVKINGQFYPNIQLQTGFLEFSQGGYQVLFDTVPPRLPAAIYAGDYYLIRTPEGVYYARTDVNALDEWVPGKLGMFKQVTQGGPIVWFPLATANAVSVQPVNCKHHGTIDVKDSVAKFAFELDETTLLQQALNGNYELVSSSGGFSFSAQSASPGIITISGQWDNVAFEQSVGHVVALAAGSLSICEYQSHPAWITWYSNSSGLVVVYYNGTETNTFFADGATGNHSFNIPSLQNSIICLQSDIRSCVSIEPKCYHQTAPVNSETGEHIHGDGSGSGIPWWEILLIVCAVLALCVIFILIMVCLCKSSGSVVVNNYTTVGKGE